MLLGRRPGHQANSTLGATDHLREAGRSHDRFLDMLALIRSEPSWILVSAMVEEDATAAYRISNHSLTVNS
jgi:hypothetical protein